MLGRNTMMIIELKKTANKYTPISKVLYMTQKPTYKLDTCTIHVLADKFATIPKTCTYLIYLIMIYTIKQLINHSSFYLFFK